MYNITNYNCCHTYDKIKINRPKSLHIVGPVNSDEFPPIVELDMFMLNFPLTAIKK